MVFPYRLIDLTHTLTPEIPSWTGGCGFRHETKLDYNDRDGDLGFRVQQLKMHAGVGTHIDAPAHCVPGGKTVEALDLKDLIVPVVCLDTSKELNPDYYLPAEEILAFEDQHGPIPKGSFFILHTGWSRYWGEPERYHNGHQFPSIHEAAATLLFDRGVVGVGIDTFSPDVPPSGFPTHRLFLGAGRYIVENIANAHQLPPTGAYILILPLKAQGVTEAPVRMLGLV